MRRDNTIKLFNKLLILTIFFIAYAILILYFLPHTVCVCCMNLYKYSYHILQYVWKINQFKYVFRLFDNKKEQQ